MKRWRLNLSGLALSGSEGVIVSYSDVEVSFDRCLGVVGRSGVGKTLLGRSIAGAMPPLLTREGDCRLAGVQEGENRLVAEEEFRYLPQSVASALPSSISVGELLNRVNSWSGKKRKPEELRELLQVVGLDAGRVAPLQAFELSGGMAQRLGVALALASAPRVLVLDEPTAGLDGESKQLLRDALGRILARGVGMIVITHDDVIADLFDVAVVLSRESDLRIEVAVPESGANQGRA